MAVGLSAFSLAPDRARFVPENAVDPAASITIRVAASIPAGAVLCFEVVCYSGLPAVSIEVNEIILHDVTINTTSDGAVTVVCGRIPNGCSGSTATITAVGPNGQVATATVAIT